MLFSNCTNITFKMEAFMRCPNIHMLSIWHGGDIAAHKDHSSIIYMHNYWNLDFYFHAF